MQSPATINYAVKFPQLGEMARVSTSEVWWVSLAPGKPPCQLGITFSYLKKQNYCEVFLPWQQDC